MFAKAFRVKSNTVIKGSDRRKLKADISVAFPSLSAEELSELVPNKEELKVVKVYAHKGDAVILYVLHKNPVFFELEKNIYPTVYTLWRYPNALPAFTTWPAVVQKLIGGADLMLPGVVVPASGLPGVKQGDSCSVTVVGSRTPVAVGIATMSSAEMCSVGMKGKGVSVLHTYMDYIWAFGDKSIPPSTPDVDNDGLVMKAEENKGKEDGCQEEACVDTDCNQDTEPLSCRVQELSITGSDEDNRENQEMTLDPEDQRTPQEQMDALLLQCFLHALKSKVKKADLPLLTSTFLRLHMFSCCPRGQKIDIKKSSYKKLSKFLQTMQQQKNLVHVKELTKGVDSIVDVDWKNPELRSFCVPEESNVEEAPMEIQREGENSYQPPEVTTLYSVSTRLEPLFRDANKRKGTALQPAEVRTLITEYVKRNELVDENNKNFVIVNPILCDCLLEKSEYQDVVALKWDDLFDRTLNRMQQCHQLVFPGQSPIIKKGQIEPIDISVASRGSNKKVTQIKNLELYGLNPTDVSSALQHRVQASAVLHPVPGTKDKVLVQIQGNQILQVCKLLIDQYQIPRKYIQGIDKVPKPGKKK